MFFFFNVQVTMKNMFSTMSFFHATSCMAFGGTNGID